jgi:NitT/TauT family transport system substrate-binding protein
MTVPARTRLIPLSLAALVALAACSSGSHTAASSTVSPSAATGGNAVTSIKVGTSPTLSNASLYQAAADGTFTAHHLAETPQQVTSGAQALPLLLNGQIQFTAADALGAITAISKHLPIEIVAQGNVNSPDPAEDSTGLVVKGGSIASVAALSGKTVAVNSLNGLAQVAAEAAIDKKGGDSSKIKFVEMGFPQMVAAVQRGTVDGAVLAEPYVTQAKQASLTDLLPVMSTSIPGVPGIVYIASDAYVKSHPAVVADFAASLNAANAELSADPAKVREVAAKSTTTSASVLAQIVLPQFTAQPLTLATLQSLEQLMVTYKVLPAPVDLTSDVYTAQG